MSSSVRRLIKDHVALRHNLPPNYILDLDPEVDQDEALSSLPDDLTQLTVRLSGAEGTPYEQGLWLLHLKIPSDYPKSPPKATFRTRIFHPNVDEVSGAVCLETLKRDWDPKLTLKDILVTISCLLIHPNPDSALNAKAGALIQEDYDAFARQAKLMTRIHAAIPGRLAASVKEAKRRGEDAVRSSQTQPQLPRDKQQQQNQERLLTQQATTSTGSRNTPTPVSTNVVLAGAGGQDEKRNDSSKENDSSALSLTVVRKDSLGKRCRTEAAHLSLLEEKNEATKELPLKGSSNHPGSLREDGGARKAVKHDYEGQATNNNSDSCHRCEAPAPVPVPVANSHSTNDSTIHEPQVQLSSSDPASTPITDKLSQPHTVNGNRKTGTVFSGKNKLRTHARIGIRRL